MIAAALLAAAALCPNGEYRVGHDNGGVIEEYEQLLADLNQQQCLVVFDGMTESAANILLGATRKCTEAPAVFNFHGPSWNGRKMSNVEFYYWRDRVAQHFPKPLRLWYLATVHDHTTIYTVKRDEMVRTGLEECE